MRKLLILAICLLPVTASAQSSENQTIEEIRKNAKIHVGPFYISPGIELKELGVDTNIFNEQDEPRSDFMFNLSPKVDVGIPFTRRALLTTSVGTDLVWYAKYKSERAVNPQLKARGELFLHRLTLFAENSFANVKQRANYEIDLRARYLDNTFSAGAGYRITPKFSLEAFGRRSLVEFDSDAVFLGTRLQNTLNRNTVGYGLVARHKLTPLTTLVLLTEQSNDKFPFSPLRDSRSVRVLPGVEFKPRALISGKASVGFRQFTPKDEALADYTGVVADLGLAYTLLGATTFGVRLNRDVLYSFEPLQPYYVTVGGGVSVRRAVRGRFDVLGSVDRYRNSYRTLLVSPGVTVLPLQSRVDTTWNYEGGFGYRVTRAARLGFAVSQIERKSNVRSDREYSGMRFRAFLTYGA